MLVSMSSDFILLRTFVFYMVFWCFLIPCIYSHNKATRFKLKSKAVKPQLNKENKLFLCCNKFHFKLHVLLLHYISWKTIVIFNQLHLLESYIDFVQVFLHRKTVRVNNVKCRKNVRAWNHSCNLKLTNSSVWSLWEEILLDITDFKIKKKKNKTPTSGLFPVQYFSKYTSVRPIAAFQQEPHQSQSSYYKNSI